jgi:hypothetical protein
MLSTRGGDCMIDGKKSNIIIVNPTWDNLINTSTDYNVFIYDVNGLFSLLESSDISDFTITYVNDSYISQGQKVKKLLLKKHNIDYINMLFIEWLNTYKHGKVIITLDEFVRNSDIYYLRSLFGRFMVTLKNILKKSVYLVRLPENFLDLFEQLGIADNDVTILVNIDKYLQQETINKLIELIDLFENNGYVVYTLYNIIDDTLQLTNLNLTDMKNCCIITLDGRVYF